MPSNPSVHSRYTRRSNGRPPLALIFSPATSCAGVFTHRASQDTGKSVRSRSGAPMICTTRSVRAACERWVIGCCSAKPFRARRIAAARSDWVSGRNRRIALRAASASVASPQIARLQISD